MNPYKIEGPTLISYSGGRTSAYMLKKMLDANNGKTFRRSVSQKPELSGVGELRAGSGSAGLRHFR